MAGSARGHYYHFMGIALQEETMNRPGRKKSAPFRKASALMAVLFVGAFAGVMGPAAVLSAGDQAQLSGLASPSGDTPRQRSVPRAKPLEPPPQSSLSLVVPHTLVLAAGSLIEPDAGALSKSGTCAPAPLIVPPTPAKIPGYAELDPSTGLHVTGTMKEIDVAHYRLEVTGKVSRPLSLTYDELRCMPRVQARPTLVCPGFFTDVATWAGTPLKHIVDLAGPHKDAKEVRLTGADGYSVSRSLADATAPANFLAYEWEGKALPALHGFPVRAVFPGLEGNQWVKWVVKIEVL